MISKVIAFALLFACLTAALPAGDYAVQNLKLNHPEGFYKCGEEVVVTGQLVKAGEPVTEGKLRAVVKWEGKILSTDQLPCDGKPFRVTYKSDKPGWVYFGFQVVGADGKTVANPAKRVLQNKKFQVAEIGAMYEPEKLRVSYPLPEDFMEFWQAERAKLDKVPFDARVEKLDSGDPAVELYSVLLRTDSDNPATGYLALPAGAKPKSLPIYIEFLSKSDCDANRRFAINGAKRGALAMAATWHGFPVGKPAEFYKKECRKISSRENLTDRVKWGYHGIYLRVLRALDYLKSRPEWNGRDLVVQGGSLGGLEASVAAALDPAVTMAVISVCGCCDFNGDLDGRRGASLLRRLKPGELTDAVRKQLAYHDAGNFMRFIKCESYFCTGFADELCTPSGVYASYNNVPATTKKVMFTNVRTGHYGTTRDLKAAGRIAEFFRATEVMPVPKADRIVNPDQKQK